MSEQRPPPRPSPPSSPPPRTISNPGSMRVITATRSQPVEEEKVPLKQKLGSGASDAALNAVSIAKEALADFKASDKFFKLKAGIVAAWLVLSAAGFVVACPGSTIFDNNNLHARLVIAGERNAPIILLYNEGQRPWTDVTIVVNENFRAAVGKVAAHDSITFTPRQLMGPGNKLAPKDLQPTDIEVRTARGHAVLMSNGEPK